MGRPAVTDLAQLEIAAAAALIAAREVKPSEVVAAAGAPATADEPLLGAFVSIDGDRAMAEALAQDDTPTAGPLRGIPVAVKDIFDVAGRPTGCGSALFADAVPATADATVVRRLREAGAIVVGKTRTHELACGVYTPPTRNPRDLDRSPGGSSGGSGAAVAAGAALAGLGSDTGGSIRIPAAHCGIVGLKPTYGRISRAGALTLSWSLDHVGPLTRSVRDAALLLSVLAGPERDDPTTAAQPPLPEPSGADVRGLRVGVLAGAPFAPLAPEQAAALALAERLLVEQGAECEHVAIPELEHALAAEFAIVAAEAASYHEARLARTPELIGDDVRGLLETGMLLPASVYLRAQRTRRAMQDAVARCFDEKRLDGLLAPTVPAGAQRLDEVEYTFGGAVEPVIDALVRTTAPHNLTGLPTIAVPVPDGDEAAPLPGSVQLAARPYDEQTALRLACALEHATGRPTPPAALDAAIAAAAAA
jgi:aspartyl-tRNA(Asn)/glutamyl-tRNA(Gln) amidotransferase subunit A